MKIENFEFVIDHLSGYEIEESICNCCGIGDANSSGLGHFINEATPTTVNISASNGSVSCCVVAYKTVENKYTVSVSNVDITKHKQKK